MDKIKQIAIAGMAGTTLCVPSSPCDERPNVIVILSDDIGYNDLTAYGQALFETPYTTRLAEEGLRLTRAHSPSAVCTPTRYALLTGTDPFRRYHTSHVLFNAEPLLIEKEEMTLADLFKAMGYRTGIVGKWHLGLGDDLPRDLNHPGRGPNETGFDYSFIVPDGHNMLPANYHENGKIYGGPAQYDSTPEVITRIGYKLLRHRPVGEWENRRPDEQIGATLADKVDAFIEASGDTPFFLYYPTCSIHFPLIPDPRFGGQSGIGPHGDYVLEFDWAVGRVMKTLDRLGLTDNTILIVTSDNGGYEPGGYRGAIVDSPHDPTYPWRGYKASQYEGGSRVPFLIRWPGKVKAGSVSDHPLSLVDLFATFAGITGYRIPPQAALDSHDVSSQLVRPGAGRTRDGWVTGTRGIEHISMYRGDWKLILDTNDGEIELYHLGNDPSETENLRDQRPDVVAALQRALDAYFLFGSSRPGAEAHGRPLVEILAEREERNAMIRNRWEK